MYRVWALLAESPLFLFLGFGAGLAWAGIAPDAYRLVLDAPLAFTDRIGRDATAWLGASGAVFGILDLDNAARVITPDWILSEVLMALVFAVAAKEVWEAIVLENGALRGSRARAPLVAAFGGMAVPALLYLAAIAIFTSGAWAGLARGWALPVSTDFALAYVAGRAILGARHPGLRFLLLLTMADDAGALLILTLVYPAADLAPAWLALPALAAAAAWLGCNRWPARRDAGNPLKPAETFVRDRLGLWPFAIAGAASWVGVTLAGLSPALGLLPIVPTLPHADRAFGIFAEAERFLRDPLNRAARALRYPAGAALFLFGLAAGRVALTGNGLAADGVSLSLAAALVVGKPLGILAALRLSGAAPGLPPGTLVVVALLSGIGLTWPIFLGRSLFALTPLGDAVVTGALLSLVAIPAAAVAARALGVARAP